MFLRTKAKKSIDKNIGGKKPKGKPNVPDFLRAPAKERKVAKGSAPYSLEEIMFYDDVIYDEW